MNKKNKYTNFKELPVWKSAHEATVEVYKITRKYPKTEIYGLTSQLRRSSSSVPANIVEGFYRNSTKELIQFLYNSRGSAGETVQHILLSRDLGYLSEKEFNKLYLIYIEILKQLSGWIRSLKIKT